MRVREDARWQSVMAAGMVFTKNAMTINAADPALPELSANKYLEISETLWPAQ